MWAKFKTVSVVEDGESVKAFRGGFNVSVNEEYRSVFRTKSYAEILIKAKLLLVNHPSSSPSSSSFTCANSFSDFLLEPAQEAIATILETTIFSKKPKIRTLIHDYFQISAEASRICSNLLTSINQFHTNYQFIQRALNISRLASEYPSPDQDHLNIKYLVSQLKSFNLLDNPFSNPNHHDFELIRDRYTSVLHRLKSKKKKVTRKMKLIKCFKRASGVCVAAACSVATVVALVIAAHTLLVLLMGPAILSLPCSKMKKKWMSFGFCRSGILRRIGMQLDVAAKGAYILNRDIDTMSRLVTRLHDEIDHSKAMIQFCLDRKDDRFCLQEVVKELGKSDNGLRKQVEDLEEHVYLCLITINRARVLVIKEMTASVARS